MTYDAWKTTPPDDDPLGEHQDEGTFCPDCGAGPDDPCEKDCGCPDCRRKDEDKARSTPEEAA